MFDSQRQSCLARISEVRVLYECISRMESGDPRVPDSTEVLMLRGLFYVHLYAALEYSVNQAVQRYLNAVSALGIRIDHFNSYLYSVILDSEFSAIRDVGESKKWERRISLLARQQSGDACAISDTVFSTYLQNVWLASLEQIFICFCIQDPVVPDQRLGLFVNEIVEKRNTVAHGRDTPSNVGRGTRSSDLKIRLDAITQVIEHVFVCFEKALGDHAFIAGTHRPNYVAKPAGAIAQ